jgi:hypothetical protein
MIMGRPSVCVRLPLARGKWPGLRETLSYTIRLSLRLKHVSEVQKREEPNIAWRLHDFIRREIKKKGASFLIASRRLECPV